MSESLEKFQKLLMQLFQLDSSDLNFGIYRIINYKREQIKNFIENEIPNIVEETFKKHKETISKDINKEFEELKAEVEKNFGNDAFDQRNNLTEKFKDTPLGKRYLEVKDRKEKVHKIEEIKHQVFNDLYSFFSRYYQDGDFLPQHRYSIKRHKYAIPYSGEEVKLYWATSEQYYIKTGLLFRDYSFKAGNFKVIFRITEAKEELGSNKATTERFFVLDDKCPIEVKDGQIIIRFQYRELTEKEVEDYQIKGGSKASKQAKINQNTFERVKADLGVCNYPELFNERESEKPNLLYHLNMFTAKNTRDYFIHKNLKRFLCEQLDYFIKAEILDIQALSQERYVDIHIARAKAVKEIGEKTIDFLSQIEDFQKRLWEKKKFVIKTEYVITTDRIPEEFYHEIWENKEQRTEWEQLGFTIPKTKEELRNEKLPVDTKYFSSEFKEKLLEKLTENADLDDLLNGLLIKSENWQALNTILAKYKEKVQTIYIDPPYNTGSDGFIYRDRYQYSSWLSMMENRLSLAREILNSEGVINISIGDTIRSEVRINSTSRLQILCNSIFGEDNYVATFIRKSGIAPRQDIKHVANSHDYVLCYAKDINLAKINRKSADTSRLKYQDAYVKQRGRFSLNQLDRGSKNYSQSLDYPIVVEKGQIIEIFRNGKFKKEPAPERIEIWPGGDPSDTTWIFTWSEAKVRWGMANGFIVFREGKNGKWKVYYKEYELVDNEGKPRQRTNPYDTLILDFTNELGTSEIENLFGKRVFEYPKPSKLIKHLLQICSKQDSIILDFFAGSGTTAHAVMKLNKEDGGRRKFILVEMADYFETIIIARLKKIAYSFNWKDGKPRDTDGIGGFFKYQILEQYEDTLDNIELNENKKAMELFKDEYLLKYFLNFETRESPCLLDIEHLKSPFSYKLKVNLSEVGEPQEMVIDIPETFNYLLGIKVKKIKKRTNNNVPYLFILGEKESKDYAIVWREYSDSWNEDKFKEDRDFIRQELLDWKPQIVYVNGQCVLTPDFGDFYAEIRPIEPDFKRLMVT